MLKERNHSIDLLRFLAATMVVFFHFNEPIPYIDNFYRNLVKFGWLGVPIFFVISGYCILLTANASKNGFDFLLRRAFRIFPGYWLSLAIILTIVLLHLLLYKVNDITILPKSLYSIISTVILNIDPISDVKGMSWVYWSLACEVCFYMVVGFGLIFKRQYLQYYFMFVLSFSIIVTNIPKGIPWYFLKDWPCFALGISIFNFHTVVSTKDKAIAMIIFMLSSIGIFIQNPINTTYNKHYIFVSFVTFFVILLSTKFKIKANFLSLMGDYSYAIYLLHIPIGIYLLGFLKKDLFVTNIYFCISFDIVNYLIVFVFSILVFKYIEKPVINFGKSLSAKLFLY